MFGIMPSVSHPQITIDWATGANTILTEAAEAVAAGWPIGAAVIAAFVGWKLIKRFVKG